MTRPIQGLEMICVCRDTHFAVRWENGQYRTPAKYEVKDLLDMTCFNCGTAYYTHMSDPIEFCPNCGRFERRRFETYRDLAEWAHQQNWKFLEITGNLVFAVCAQERDWYLSFARDAVHLEISGNYLEVRPLQEGPNQ